MVRTDVARLVVHDPGEIAIALRVEPGARIGRDASCEVALADVKVSRVHATLERDADGWWLVDGGSRHGTWVNGARVEQHRRRQPRGLGPGLGPIDPLGAQGIGAAMAAPIHTGDRVAGFVYVDHSRTDRFGPDELALLAAVATLIGAAIAAPMPWAPSVLVAPAGSRTTTASPRPAASISARLTTTSAPRSSATRRGAAPAVGASAISPRSAPSVVTALASACANRPSRSGARVAAASW